MLIKGAQIDRGGRKDIRVTDGLISEIGELQPHADFEVVIDARGNALLPGLHDHHLHLLAYAASLESVRCGPPSVMTANDLATALQARENANRGSWIRGIGYHSSVAGDIDRHWLDKVVSESPVRIQERSGRLWILNSCALDLIAPEGESPLERAAGRLTGRLYNGDVWLRSRVGKTSAAVRNASQYLLSRGVTGITDTTPSNGNLEFELFEMAQADGDLTQDVLMMGGASLDGLLSGRNLRVGAQKIHLHDADLPVLADVCHEIQRSHKAGRPVAIRCVTLAELVFALSAYEEGGVISGDRIEHASVTPTELLPLIARLGLTVVTQPNFIMERGDRYLEDVDLPDRPYLYRQRAFLEAAIPLAGGTDAPFGDPDPWQAMLASVTRRTRLGALVGEEEALTPEEALGLFCGHPDDPGRRQRRIRVGERADLCLLDRTWQIACLDLGQVRIEMTFKDGRIAWRR